MSDEKNEVVVRLACTEDAERVALLSAQLDYPVTQGQTAEYLALILADDRHAFYVAVADDTVIGWIHACTRRLVQVGLVVELEGLVVDQAYRRRGVGQRLVEQAEQWAGEKGCSRAYVRSNITRKGAHAFYQDMGFEQRKTSLTFHKVFRDNG